MAQLHHVALRARDFERSVRFYTEGLGLGKPYLWNAPPFVSRAAFIPTGGGGWIEIFAIEPDADAPVAGEQQGGMAHLALAYEDPHAAYERAVAAGGQPIEAPTTRTLHGEPPIEATLGWLLGPDNEMIEIYRNDHLPFSQEES